MLRHQPHHPKPPKPEPGNYVFGYHAVRAVLEHSSVNLKRLLVQAGKNDKNTVIIKELADKYNVNIEHLSRPDLDLLLPSELHQGIIAELSKNTEALNESHLDQLLNDSKSPKLFLVLDGVQDPHNLGACLRTANAAGVDAVIIPKDNSVGLTGAVRKVASGAAEITPLIQVTNLARTLRKLKDYGIWIYGTSDQAQQSIFGTNLKGSIALVLGAEGKGMRRLTEDLCDFIMCIPMHGTVSSLNVSVATGICLFEAIRQR